MMAMHQQLPRIPMHACSEARHVVPPFKSRTRMPKQVLAAHRDLQGLAAGVVQAGKQMLLAAGSAAVVMSAGLAAS